MPDKDSSVDISESFEALILENIKAEHRIQHNKKYFIIAGMIANAVHEICTQLMMISHLITLLKKQDRANVTNCLGLDYGLVKKLAAYIEKMDNLPSSLRKKALDKIQNNLIKPVIEIFSGL